MLSFQPFFCNFYASTLYFKHYLYCTEKKTVLKNLQCTAASGRSPFDLPLALIWLQHQ